MPTSLHIVHPGGYMQCTCYLVRGPAGAVLIDVGSGCEEAALLANIAAAGVAFGDLRGALLTHCHTDHAMGAGRLQRRGLKVYASRVTAAKLRGADAEIWGEHPELVPAITVDGELADGQRLSLAGLEFLCVPTPGHTAGCMSFILDTAEPPRLDSARGHPPQPAKSATFRTAFTGDVVCDNGHPGWAGGPDFSEAATLQSIERLLALAPEFAWWGHGGPIRNPGDWLRAAADLGRHRRWHLGTAYSYFDVPPVLATTVNHPG